MENHKLAVPMYVQPSQATPYEVIPLTAGSLMAGLNTLVSTHVLLFKPPTGPADRPPPSDIIRSGLSQLLVPYYPLAGRIVENETGWEVQCDGRGAVFIVTTAPDFEEVVIQGSPLEYADTSSGLPETVIAPPPSDLALRSLPPPPPASTTTHTHDNVPALMVTVTELETGGFVLAIKLYHGICDTAGLLHFLCGWAELARGKPHISVMPLWGNKKMPYDPSSFSPRVTYDPSSFSPRVTDFFGKYQNTFPTNHPSIEENAQYQVHVPNLARNIQDSELYGGENGTLTCNHHKMFRKAPITEKVKVDIPFEVIKALRDWILTEENYSCTAAQVLVAHVWRERTRALQVPDNDETRLFFISKSQQDHPVVFYGSFTFNCQVKAKASDLVNLPLVYAVQLVQEAEANLVYNFTTCTHDFKHVHCSCGFTPLEVLLFTSLPTTNVEKNLDFGALGKPRAPSLDVIHFPSNVNIAALVPPSHAYESTFHIIMNNILFVHVNELRSLLCNMPIHTSIDSKI